MGSSNPIADLKRSLPLSQVRLVLEFCDMGDLISLSEQGAFLCNGALNYHAILDTALDVAKAMCHLHAMNVLHSDLKVWVRLTCVKPLSAYLTCTLSTHVAIL